MNWHHLQAFLWMRRRILVNQIKRAGAVNAVFLIILIVLGALFAVGVGLTSFIVGLLVFAKVPSWTLMYVWDGVIALFLFTWCISVITELQRSEVLSLDKILHLPVSVTGAFLINYLSSLFSLTLLAFLPVMIGLALALPFTKGPIMLLLWPLLAALLLAVTAITYQFQSWLATLMTNQRRRRTIIVALTAIFIVVCQLPNVVNIVVQPWKNLGDHPPGVATAPATDKNGETGKSETGAERTIAWFVDMTPAVRIINMALPPGWLPLGAMDLADGAVLPALLGTLGLSLIGAGSLWRSYKTTLRLYAGQFTSKRQPRVAVTPQTKSKPADTLLDKKLPWLSENAAAVALASFQSLIRAPEAKMLLMTPVILLLVFGAMFFSRSTDIPEIARPLLPLGAMALTLVSTVQLVGNQFGFDRSGFRVYVLCPAPRKDILLGKNLSLAPLVLLLGLVIDALVWVVYPMRIDHFLAVPPLLVAMYLMFCLLANCLSILAPMPMSSASLKPINPRVIPILLQVAFLVVFPMVLAPMFLPLGIEYLLQQLGWIEIVPVALILSVLEAVAVIYVYRVLLHWQGMWLHAWEQRILDTVTSKTE